MGKNIDKNILKSEKYLDHAKPLATDALKTASKRAIYKTAEATGDLIGNNVVDRIIEVSKNITKQ